jgi:hypothetical protein
MKTDRDSFLPSAVIVATRVKRVIYRCRYTSGRGIADAIRAITFSEAAGIEMDPSGYPYNG